MNIITFVYTGDETFGACVCACNGKKVINGVVPMFTVYYYINSQYYNIRLFTVSRRAHTAPGGFVRFDDGEIIYLSNERVTYFISIGSL